MKIQGWSVERFGALRSYDVRDLPDGLTVLCGPNGSGKSTLVAFIRQILFGSGRHDADGRGAALLPDTWAGRLNCAGARRLYAVTHQGERASQVHVALPMEETWAGPAGSPLRRAGWTLD